MILFIGLCFIFFLVLIVRLFQLTIVKGSYYKSLSENNRVREVIIEPQRGVITDRFGTVLASSIKADYKKRRRSNKFISII